MFPWGHNHSRLGSTDTDGNHVVTEHTSKTPSPRGRAQPSAYTHPNTQHRPKVPVWLKGKTRVLLINFFKKRGDLPGSPVVKILFPVQGMQVRSLVGELRSHMPYGVAKKLKTHK